MDKKLSARLENLKQISPRVSEVIENMVALDPSCMEHCSRAVDWLNLAALVGNPPPEGTPPVLKELHKEVMRECFVLCLYGSESEGFFNNIFTPILKAGFSDIKDFIGERY